MVDEKQSWTNRATEILIDSAAAEYFDRHRSYLRLVLAGNAGGLFAILTIIGTFMGADRYAQLPASLFYIELIYVVGLCGALIGTVTDAWTADQALKIKSMTPATGQIKSGELEHFQTLRSIWKFGAFVALACLIVGTVWALGLLHIAAGSPPLPTLGKDGGGPG